MKWYKVIPVYYTRFRVKLLLRILAYMLAYTLNNFYKKTNNYVNYLNSGFPMMLGYPLDLAYEEGYV